LAAPSGAFVHSNEMRSLFVSSDAKSNGSQVMVIMTDSCSRCSPGAPPGDLGVEDTARRVDGQTLHVGRLDRPADAVRAVVGEAHVVDELLREGRVEHELQVLCSRWWGTFLSGWVMMSPGAPAIVTS